MKSIPAALLFLVFTLPGIPTRAQDKIRLDIRIKYPAGKSDTVLIHKLIPETRLVADFSGLEAQIGKIITVLENSGYPFASAKMDSIVPGQPYFSGILLLDPGAPVSVDTLMNRTGYRISAPVLSRLMNIRPGDPYRETYINTASYRIESLGYMKLARPLEVGFHDGKASVFVYPEKGGANRFDGWVGLSPDLRTTGKMAFSGSVLLNLSNLLAQGENWQLDWRRSQDASQKLDLAANIPYLAGLPVGLQAGFNLFRQDTGYLNVSWDAGVPYHFSPGHFVSVFVKSLTSNVIDNPLNPVKNRISFSGFQSGFRWELNRLDSRVNPYRGLSVWLLASTGKKSARDSLPVSQSQFSGAVSWFLPVARSMTMHLRLDAAMIAAPEIFENEQYRLGGLNLLRGFDENRFHANAYAVTSLEFRYLLDRESHLLILADLGMVRESNKPGSAMQFPAGFGVGGQLRTGGGIFRIIFAIGKEGGESLNFRNSKIHLGYIGVF